VSQSERRLAEAAKMGISTAFMAHRSVPSRVAKGIRPVGVRTVAELFAHLFQ
jgi:DNA repair protein RadA/Sms